MSRYTRFLATTGFMTCAAGAALAQMAGGGMGGTGTSSSMMSGAMGAQMMGGQMMKADMMSGMVGTMIQMNQIMEKMAGRMSVAMDMRTMTNMSDAMDDMSGMMKEMATQMRSGRMDPALMTRMNARMAAMNKALDASEPQGSVK